MNLHLLENRYTANDILEAPILNISGIHRDVGNLMVVAPHPDDESLGCGGLIVMLRELDKNVIVIFITDGGGSHPGSTLINSDQLAAIRRVEAIHACKDLGVQQQSVYFLNQPDGHLSELNTSVIATIGKTIIDIAAENNIDSIAVTWRRDHHPDHLMTNQIITTAIKNSKKPFKVLEFPIWLWKKGTEQDWPLKTEVDVYKLAIENQQHKKIKAIHQHKSQLGLVITDDPTGFVLTSDLLTPFLGSFEYYFINVEKSTEPLSDNYFNNLYKNSDDPWGFLHNAYEKDKYLKTIELLKNETFSNGLEIGCSIGEHTRYLAKKCQSLLAVDINAIAIQSAKKRNSANTNIVFKCLNIKKNFPNDTFDFISFCEVGYYFDNTSLLKLFTKIDRHLIINGTLLMVHWTSYVSEYPLSGRRVHSLFLSQYKTSNKFEIIQKFIHSKYELYIFKKRG